MANSWEHKTPNLVCLCPLTIDEYPLLRALESPQKQQDKVVFPLGMRWNVREFWKDEILLFDEAKTPGEIVLEEEEVRAAAGMIVADVGLRDYQLVRQSRRLAVLNPWYRTKGADNAEPSSGVLSEIMVAGEATPRVPVAIFQDEERHDNGKKARTTLLGHRGSLGRDPRENWIHFNDNPDEVFRSVTS